MTQTLSERPLRRDGSRHHPGRLDGRHPRIVALGGGTGLPVLLRGLKAALFPPAWTWVPERDRECVTAVVTAADDGLSSGCLRQEVLPPGDLRHCLLALSDGDPTMAALFDFEFSGPGEIAGHSLGNLILTALSQLEDDGFLGALKQGSELLRIRGRVLPATLQSFSIRAEFFDGGSNPEGESRIASVGRLIHRVVLEPSGVSLLPEARTAIETATLLVLGPGSLYTNIIPALLVDDLGEAIARSRARVALIMNLMTQPGQTENYTAVDHVLALRRHAPGIPIHDVVLNTMPIPHSALEAYAAQGAIPVSSDAELLRALGYRLLERDLLGDGPTIRHDPLKLAYAVLDLDDEAGA